MTSAARNQLAMAELRRIATGLKAARATADAEAPTEAPDLAFVRAVYVGERLALWATDAAGAIERVIELMTAKPKRGGPRRRR